jgi:hypothetical protein
MMQPTTCSVETHLPKVLPAVMLRLVKHPLGILLWMTISSMILKKALLRSI